MNDMNLFYKQLTFLFLFLFLLISGRQNNEFIESDSVDDWSYLSIDETKDIIDLTSTELEILGAAYKRLDIIKKEGLFFIKQSSGNEINISEYMFKIFKENIQGMNDEFLSSDLNLSTPRTRSNEEGGNDGSNNDCVAYTICALMQSFGEPTPVSDISSNLSSVYGSGGVPASKLSEALNMYVYAEPIPIPPYYSWTVANQVVAAIDQGSFYHMVTILGTNGGTVFYRDDQNGRYLTCPSHLIRSVFRVSGVR